MKKVISLILTVALCLSLCACGKSESVEKVEALIAKIGEVNLDSESAIATAETAYDVLEEKEKARVENYTVLTDARAAFDTLVEEEARKEEARKQVYYGEWKNILYDEILSFHADNYGTMWELTEQGIKIGGVSFVYEDCGDFVRLVGADENNDSIFVPTEYLTSTEVELTMENWTEYIQLQEAAFFITDQFDEVVQYEVWLLATFKDEIADRIDRTAGKKYMIDSKFVGSEYCGTISVDEETKEFSLLGEPELTMSEFTLFCEFRQRDIAEYIQAHIGDSPTPQGWTPLNCIMHANPSEDNPDEWTMWSYVPEYTPSSMEGTLLLYDLPLHK